MIKIIFSDMDGTLLDEKGNLPDGFDEMIARIKSRNVIFAPASGRQYYSLRGTFEKYKDEFLFVAENGTIAFHKGKEIFSSPMPRQIALDILNTGEPFEKIMRVFCGKKNAYVLESQDKPEYQKELEKYFTHNEAVKKFDEVNDEPLKMSFFDPTGKSAESIYPILKKKFGDTMQVVLASDYWTDVINADINKGVAVQNIQKNLGIKPEECAAFGDYLNDVQMLQAVKYSFAMANAHPDLKKFANYETVSNADHGVLVGIKKLIEKNLI